jgi:hypothetical protein
MNVCPKCGYKVISKAMFERHMTTHEIDVVPVTPVVEAPKAEEIPVDDSITIRFTKPVEIYINSKAYLGKEIKVKDMNIASEIVRIAREAYGPTILM